MLDSEAPTVIFKSSQHGVMGKPLKGPRGLSRNLTVYVCEVSSKFKVLFALTMVRAPKR